MASPKTSKADSKPLRHRFTLRQLEAFTQVARNGSVSAAATQLSRTQSAISMGLQELESALGCNLFERRGRRLVRTDAAETLLPRAIEMVERAREISDLVADGPQTRARLAIGSSRTIGPFVIPEIIRRSCDRVAGLQIQLIVANSEDLVKRVHSFELDCAFIEGDVTDHELNKQAWLTDELCLFACQSHPLFKKRRSKTSPKLETQLADYPWVLREPGSGSREIFLRAIATVIPQPTVSLEVNDPETQKRCVRNSAWISCISRRAIADELRSGELREVTGLPAGFKKALTRRFWIVTHPTRFRSDAMHQLLEIAGSTPPR